MPRPPKPPGERKDYHLRVPLSDAQRSLVEQAAMLDGEDKAAWARAILLEAARRRIEKARKSGGKPT